MNRIFLVLILLPFASCKNKKKPDSTKAFFSVVDFTKAQARHIDTTAFTITKIESVDSLSDTTIVPKQDFRKYAKDFLELPDISSGSRMDNYEESNTYDEQLNNVLLIYEAKDDEEEVRRETIMLEPDELGNTQPKTILINTIKSEGGSIIEKDMTWHVNRHFQVVTKLRKPGQPEKITTRVIKWQ